MKKAFRLHPLLCLLDATGEALAGLRREGRAGSNTTADHAERLQAISIAVAVTAIIAAAAAALLTPEIRCAVPLRA